MNRKSKKAAKPRDGATERRPKARSKQLSKAGSKQPPKARPKRTPEPEPITTPEERGAEAPINWFEEWGGCKGKRTSLRF